MIAKTSAQKHHRKTAYLHLVPATEIVADFEPAGEKTRHNKRFDIELRKDEFVADGQDELAVVVYVHRVGAKADLVYPGSAIKEMKLGGTAAAEYQLVEDEAFAAEPANQGRRRFLVHTKDHKPLLHTAARASATLTLDAEGQVPAPHARVRAATKAPTVIKAQVPVTPRCMYLALWVVPGQIRGTSTVGVGSFLCRGKGEWVELKLGGNELEVKAVSPQVTASFTHAEVLVSTGGPSLRACHFAAAVVVGMADGIRGADVVKRTGGRDQRSMPHDGR